MPRERYLEIPAGYFNFIEKVIEPDMYAYSIFPRFDGSSVLLERSNAVALGQKKAGNDDGWLGFGASDDEQIASVVPGFIGFTDSDSDRRINFGWIVDLADPGHAFQKSQFALISVPAWTSRLTVNVQSGWLNTRTGALDPDEDYQFRVPLPPDFEAFDAFIGGKEAVRRPKISNELMEKPVFSRCKRNAILIPGFRLWRSAMVTVGSEMADRIVVLPNMRGIIAEFPPSDASLRGSTSHVVRVWTSEGMDSIRDAVSYADDADSCSKPEDNPAGKLKVSDSSGIPPQTPVVEGSDEQ